MHPGVYVDPYGSSDVVAGRVGRRLLAVEPAALAGSLGTPRPRSRDGCRRSWQARRTSGTPTIHVAVDRDRHVMAPRGCRSAFADRTSTRRALLHLSPPRLRLDEALLDVADGAVPRLRRRGRACRRLPAGPDDDTTDCSPFSVRRSRLRRRLLLTELLGDVAVGVLIGARAPLRAETSSVRTAFPRRASPAARRHAPVDRDVPRRRVLGSSARCVELDGRLVHATPGARWHGPANATSTP